MHYWLTFRTPPLNLDITNTLKAQVAKEMGSSNENQYRTMLSTAALLLSTARVTTSGPVGARHLLPYPRPLHRNS